MQEDKRPGYTVLQFEVTDADTDMNGPPFKFDIVEGQPDHEFKVDEQGVLTTAARFNRDIKDQYDLVIRVYDNGSPSLFTDTTVRRTVCESSLIHICGVWVFGMEDTVLSLLQQLLFPQLFL